MADDQPITDYKAREMIMTLRDLVMEVKNAQEKHVVICEHDKDLAERWRTDARTLLEQGRLEVRRGFENLQKALSTHSDEDQTRFTEVRELISQNRQQIGDRFATQQEVNSDVRLEFEKMKREVGEKTTGQIKHWSIWLNGALLTVCAFLIKQLMHW